MGFFSWVASKIETVKEAIKENVSKVKDKVVERAHKLKDCVTNVWSKFTGRDKFKEAEQLYDKITTRYNSKRKQFDEDLDCYLAKIEKHVEVINKSKERIKRELFISMAKKMEKIKDIAVSSDFSVEEYVNVALSFDSIRGKSELYKIDFNKHKVKTTIQAIFTFGILTRKKAKETLYAVQEEEKKIDCEIEKMNAEIIKLKAIEEALDNVEMYFTSLISLYERLLIRLDNSVNFLYIRCMNFAHKIVSKEMSIRRLPVMQRKEVEAIITASKILKEMTDAQITSIEDRNEVNTYLKNMKEQHCEMNKMYEAV